MSFLVSALLALAAVGTVLGAAFYVGLISPGGNTATASGTPRPPGSFVPQTARPSPSVVVSVAPSPTLEPSTPVTPGGTYTVKPGDSLSLIGDKVGVPWTQIAEANGILPPDYVVQVGQVLIIPIAATFNPASDTYVVQAGDSITKIANQFGIDPTTLADYNNIVDWNSIPVGLVRQIPPDDSATPLPTGSPE
jgi:LysM repeat protein